MSEALLLAAGRGERLRPFTDTVPKPLLSDGHSTLLDRHLHALQAAGVSRVVINLGWLGERIVEHVGDGQRYGLTVVYSPEGYPTLDTGGAIRQALGVMADAPFWVVNSDVHTDFAFDIAPATLLAGRDAAIGLAPTPDYRPNGDFGLRDGLAKNDAEPLLTFSGIACYQPRFFAGTAAERFSVVPMLRAAADADALSGFALAANWFDVGTPERLSQIRQRVRGD
ncbi:MAG: nucleotidyltransferase family protein [Pseudomonadota bacterium]